MKEYGKIGQKILDIKCEIEELNQQTIKFKDYQKAKKEMEFEKIKSVANFKPQPTGQMLIHKNDVIEELEEEQKHSPRKKAIK